ncbi:hypothetical protein [Desertivirga xinjiangensis]|uniref:hypothetical protein n=1 Tax=Desertivirga xinjiangensis TaxID=539206 RepID=UPI00210EADBE|nr:hypothetical protein [Pedobacter xinjiangensis]
MNDKLENFIRDNKKQFDEFEPPADLWGSIEKGLDQIQKNAPRKERVVKLSVLLKIAAGIVIVLGAALFLLPEKDSAPDIVEINPKMAKQEFQYASLIEEKRNQLKQLEAKDPGLYREFLSELKVIDDSYQKLKRELTDSPNQEETVKAMILNMKIQIEVLNQQLEIIREVNKVKKGHNNGLRDI